MRRTSGCASSSASARKIADRTQAYVTRAVAARVGLWGNHGYEADYAAIWVDSDGNELDGSNRYELRLERPPPVETMTDVFVGGYPDVDTAARDFDALAELVAAKR